MSDQLTDADKIEDAKERLRARTWADDLAAVFIHFNATVIGMDYKALKRLVRAFETFKEP